MDLCNFYISNINALYNCSMQIYDVVIWKLYEMIDVLEKLRLYYKIYRKRKIVHSLSAFLLSDK